ncbi:elongator complex protein 4-like [Moniliophthora roreri MCA 2997]|uniref:Elongator complex protein 4 n=1 Tax=Moniliophthora roreri (strain MCA 2997) TaxID=1381753 RepID=V2XGQ9_MONRO|nr:elongator complex protein 4-like [Moniliophthora roreri MCA 2997]
MSSFKRKTTSKQTATLPGTRVSPGSIATVLTSTGIPSLDDILGGGLPLSCSLVVTAPDQHSSYGELVQKYFVAQGFVSKHNILLIGEDPSQFAKACMWMSGSSSLHTVEAEEEGEAERSDEKIKIAWRYENLKPFQTTVGPSTPSTEDYCATFDLTTRIPDSFIQKALSTGQLSICDVNSFGSEKISTVEVISHLEGVLESKGLTTPLRICVPTLGSPSWGVLSVQDISRFLQSVRTLLRHYTNACVSISIAPHLSSENWGGPGWIHKLGWLSDSLVTLAAFTANPSMSALFPGHHGLVHIYTLPAPHTLLPPSNRFSTLRGLSAAADSCGSGENNLAFKCTRKRLIFETMHLDVEGGVSERRTTPSSNTLDVATSSTIQDAGGPKAQFANIEVEIEEKTKEEAPVAVSSIAAGVEKMGISPEGSTLSQGKSKKPKKRVGFRSDRPDLYDF